MGFVGIDILGMKFLGINTKNFRQTGWYPRNDNVIFWGVVALAVLLLVFIFVGGLLFYQELTPDKSAATLQREPATLSAGKIDEVIRKLDERKIKLDELLTK